MSDSFDLRRFIEAQEPVYRQVVEELSRGRKRSHWMWFVFPQIAGLGFSAMARRFAIGSRAEAVAYLRHDVLGPRLIECTRLVMASEKTIGRHEISIVHDVVRRGLSSGDFRRAIGAFYPDGKDLAMQAILEGARPGAAGLNRNPADPPFVLRLA